MKKRIAASVVGVLIGIGFALSTERPPVQDTYISVRCDAARKDYVYRIVKTETGVQYVTEDGTVLDRIPEYCWPLTGPRNKV